MRQAPEHHKSLSLDYRQRAEKAWRLGLLYAAALLIAHLLDIRPSSVDTFGLKIDIQDVRVLYGAIGCLVLFQFYSAFSDAAMGAFLFATHEQSGMLRSFVYRARRRTSPRRRKLQARIALNLYYLAIAPFAFSVVLVTMLGASVALYDVWQLGTILLAKGTVAQFFPWPGAI
ncbi:MAG: hypothetical protein V4618_00055 [Pseudomonadota bacterium]